MLLKLIDMNMAFFYEIVSDEKNLLNILVKSNLGIERVRLIRSRLDFVCFFIYE